MMIVNQCTQQSQKTKDNGKGDGDRVEKKEKKNGIRQ